MVIKLAYYYALAHGFPTILILDSSGFHIKLSEVVKSVAVSVSPSLLLKGSGWPQKSGVTTNQRPVSRSCDHSRPIRSQVWRVSDSMTSSCIFVCQTNIGFWSFDTWNMKHAFCNIELHPSVTRRITVTQTGDTLGCQQSQVITWQLYSAWPSQIDNQEMVHSRQCVKCQLTEQQLFK